MQKFDMYSLYDKASQTYGQVLCFVSDAVAIRCLREALADMTSIMAKFPDDYQLVKVGEFLIDSGQINPVHEVLFDDLRALLPERGGRAVGGDTPPEAAERPQSVDADPKVATSEPASR